MNEFYVRLKAAILYRTCKTFFFFCIILHLHVALAASGRRLHVLHFCQLDRTLMENLAKQKQDILIIDYH